MWKTRKNRLPSWTTQITIGVLMEIATVIKTFNQEQAVEKLSSIISLYTSMNEKFLISSNKYHIRYLRSLFLNWYIPKLKIKYNFYLDILMYRIVMCFNWFVKIY